MWRPPYSRFYPLSVSRPCPCPTTRRDACLVLPRTASLSTSGCVCLHNASIPLAAIAAPASLGAFACCAPCSQPLRSPLARDARYGREASPLPRPGAQTPTNRAPPFCPPKKVSVRPPQPPLAPARSFVLSLDVPPRHPVRSDGHRESLGLPSTIQYTTVQEFVPEPVRASKVSSLSV